MKPICKLTMLALRTFLWDCKHKDIARKAISLLTH